MRWKGMAIGGLLGWIWGRALGAVFGAIIGYRIEQRICRMRSGGTPSPIEGSLSDDYAILGVDASADDLTVRDAYRNLAKRNHPDTLRAQGLSESELLKATERMSRINAAWTRIKSARGM